MFEKLSEVKVLRDPIHGYIHVDLQVIWDCINSREVQRLKRIRQLGGAFQVYHTAEHSRFAHSLGVYEIARRMVEEIRDLRQTERGGKNHGDGGRSASRSGAWPVFACV